MKKSEAIKICKDFDLVTTSDGRKVCIHKMGDDCDLATHKTCELILHHRKQQPAPVSALATKTPTRLAPTDKKIFTLNGWADTERSKKFALKLCSDLEFIETRTGDLSCKHKYENLCEHDNHFDCEIVRFEQRKAAKKARGGVQAISASRIGVLDSCARKYAFQYVHDMREGTPIYFLEGTAFSNGRAKIDMGMDWGLPNTLPEVSYRKIKASLRFYQKFPPYPVGSVECETETSFEFDGEFYTGYLDSITLDKKTINEWKFAMQPYDALKGARQAAVYFSNFDEAETLNLITFGKPMHKPSKGGRPTKKNPTPKPESMQEYEERVFAALCEKGPEAVYKRVTYKRDDVMVMNILSQMNAKFRMLPIFKEADWPPSYQSCQNGCDFTKYCSKHLGKSTTDIAQVIKQARNEKS